MFAKFLSQLLGNSNDAIEAADDYEQLMELEDGGWVIVNVPENILLSAPEAGPLEDLLIEHPSMSVYQMRCRVTEEEEEEDPASDDDDDDGCPRPVAVKHISLRLAAWGIPLPRPVQLLAVQKARAQAERRMMSRGALHRQNMARARFSPTGAEKRHGHAKQPCQRLCNY